MKEGRKEEREKQERKIRQERNTDLKNKKQEEQSNNI